MQKPVNLYKTIYCRWSPTLGALEGTAERVWGTAEYEGDRDDPTVFFGLYGLPDFYTLWRHRGKKWILWAGSDITHFRNGYWLEEGGGIKIEARQLSPWINKHCESWVENEVEREALAEVGIEAKVCPSFMGIAHEYGVSYQPAEKPKVYSSVSGDNFKLYGWDLIPDLAKKYPDIEFHLYGSTSNPWPTETWPSYMPLPNIYLHGRVPKEQMNEEIKQMQGGLRLTEFDGFSEILAKSVLWGQWPISLIKYPHMLSVDEIGTLKGRVQPNYAGRHYYLSNLNKFPWNLKK